MSRARSWCFTLNNPTPDEWARLLTLAAPYWVMGDEVGENGTPHVQGYVQFGKVVRFNAAKEMLGPRVHLEPAKGTPEQASAYCKKDGKFQEFGELRTPHTGGRMEKERFRDALKRARDGDLDGLAQEHPDLYTRYQLTYLREAKLHRPMPAPVSELNNWWYFGSTGTGKSRKAREENPGYYLKRITKWWDGYQGQDVVIIEEWHPDVVPALQQMLKEWADHHPFQAEYKGGSMIIRPKKIIVTSNYAMNECFSDMAILDPLLRRFKIANFDSGVGL